MKYEIRNRFTGITQFVAEIAGRFLTVEGHKKRLAVLWAIANGVSMTGADLACALLDGAILDGAILNGAILDGASLNHAILNGASLNGAILDGASLNGASLNHASLNGASLDGTSLNGAILDGASLNRASLNGASLNHATLPTGETWEEYLGTVVPSLLVAGGKSLSDVATEEHWKCHDWDNCPMAAAFGIHSADKAPLLLRQRVQQFVQFFDAGLIPLPKVDGR